MDVLRQAHIALVLMFCAGWVHRDVSSGNVLAFRKNEGWQVQIADLEYAKRFPSDNASFSDPKAGTPYFMAHEIYTGMSMYREPLPTADRFALQCKQPGVVERIPRMHTFQHDIESLWWLPLWLVTRRIGHRDSAKAAENVFRQGDTPSATRTRTFLFEESFRDLTDKFHAKLESFIDPLEVIRYTLVRHYANRRPDQITDTTTYVGVVACHFVFFRAIEVTRNIWGSMKLAPNSNNIPEAKSTDVVPRVTVPALNLFATPQLSSGSKRKNTFDDQMEAADRATSPAAESSTGAGTDSGSGSRAIKRVKEK